MFSLSLPINTNFEQLVFAGLDSLKREKEKSIQLLAGERQRTNCR